MLKTLIPSKNVFRSILLSPRLLAYSRDINDKSESDNASKKKKRETETKIMLINENQTVTVINLSEAQKLAKHNDLKLVKSLDPTIKSTRPVYRLMNSTQFHDEDIAKRKEKKLEKAGSKIKGVKLMTLASNIGEHDLQTKIRQMVNFVSKKYEVRIVINIQSMSKAESIYESIAKEVSTFGRVLQKRVTGLNLKFQVLPTKETLSEQPSKSIHTDESSNNSEDNKDSEKL